VTEAGRRCPAWQQQWSKLLAALYLIDRCCECSSCMSQCQLQLFAAASVLYAVHLATAATCSFAAAEGPAVAPTGAQPCYVRRATGWLPWNDRDPTSRMRVSPLVFQGCVLKGAPPVLGTNTQRQGGDRQTVGRCRSACCLVQIHVHCGGWASMYHAHACSSSSKDSLLSSRAAAASTPGPETEAICLTAPSSCANVKRKGLGTRIHMINSRTSSSDPAIHCVSTWSEKKGMMGLNARHTPEPSHTQKPWNRGAEFPAKVSLRAH
jgi:hypothetical protein